MSTRAQWESLISSFIALTDAENNPDTRGQVRTLLEDAMSAINVDETAWSVVKTKYLYDIYLQMRTDEGTITKTDLTRTGLHPGLFSSTDEWHAHCHRVSENNKSEGREGEKTCSMCGQTKHISKFKKNGGSKCGACQAKAYRERRAAK